jgi:hypothetical protein
MIAIGVVTPGETKMLTMSEATVSFFWKSLDTASQGNLDKELKHIQ